MSPIIGSQEMQARLAGLHSSLEAARKLSADELAAQIKALGFECRHCGDCCTGEDNSVVIFPFEIRRIMAFTGWGWLETTEPPAEGEWDGQGNLHTLEWRVKKEKGSCRFFSEGSCRIYAARPFICSTYPFYLDSGFLRCSECRGLGARIEFAEAEKMASLIIERSKSEILEAIALLEMYEDFERGEQLSNGACIVHDSEGEHRISFDLIIPSISPQ